MSMMREQEEEAMESCKLRAELIGTLKKGLEASKSFCERIMEIVE